MVITQVTAAQVDTLGNLLAEIAILTKQADAIKDAIKDGGATVEGNLFKATYLESNRKSFDKTAFIAAHSQTEFDRFQQISAVFSVKVVSR